MINLYLINQTFIFLIVIIGILIACWIFFADKKNKINQLFFLFTSAMLIYLIFGYLSHCPDQIYRALLWKKLFLGGVSLFLIFTYYFSVFFPRKGKTHPTLDKIVLGSEMLFLFLIIFTNLIIKDVEIQEWGTNIVWGVGKNIWFGLMMIFTFLIVGEIFKKYFLLPVKEKFKVQYFLIGIFIFASLNFVFNMIFPLLQNTFRYYYLGDYSAIFLLTFTAYAIVKKELFDIKIVLTSTFVGLIAILLLLDVFFLTPDFVHQLFKILILVIFLYFGYSLIKSVLNEIERRKQLEKLTLKLERANIRLKELIEMKEEFLHITSHQLRTPLTAIRGMVSMWCEGDFKKLSKEKRDEVKKRIYLSTERLNNITNDMIDAMELEGGGRLAQHNFKPVSLVKIIQDTIETLKTNFDKNNLYINFKHPKNLPEVPGEENYLRQVFLNLIDNAQKYTSKGGVDINLKKENNFLVCEIADTGVGISEEDKRRLFKKFSRGSKAEQFHVSGTGLGLFIAKKILEEHNGKISVFSKGKNKGTTFKIWLPIRNKL